MNNIFEIQQSLLNVFNEIEENEGELTPELEEKLTITQEDFKQKLKSYADVIKYLNNDISLIDAESKRLVAIKKFKQNTIDKLNKIIIEAIDRFGDITKSGTKFFDYGTGKIMIKKTNKVEANEYICEQLSESVFARLGFMGYSNILDATDCVDEESLIKSIKEEISDSINVNDLDAVNANISFDLPLGEILKGEGYDFIKSLIKHTNFLNYKVKPSVNKSLIKKESDSEFYVGKVVENKIVQLK